MARSARNWPISARSSAIFCSNSCLSLLRRTKQPSNILRSYRCSADNITRTARAAAIMREEKKRLEPEPRPRKGAYDFLKLWWVAAEHHRDIIQVLARPTLTDAQLHEILKQLMRNATRTAAERRSMDVVPPT